MTRTERVDGKPHPIPLLDLSWVPDGWWQLLTDEARRDALPERVKRRYFEACVFSQLMLELNEVQAELFPEDKLDAVRRLLRPHGIPAPPATVAVGMTASGIGPIGIGAAELGDVDPGLAEEAARELEDLGYSTIWLAGRQQNNLPLINRVVRATLQVQVASGILPVDAVPAATVAAGYADLERTNPGRFLVGLGGAHGPHPLQTLETYLDELDARTPGVPISARVLSALGPRALALARDRSAGAYPFLVTPEYTQAARSILGDGKLLAVLVMVVMESDPHRARSLARQPFGFFRGPYVSNFRRMGFSQAEIDTAADRLIDGITVWGSSEAIAEKIAAYHTAGADQVVLSVVTPTGELPREHWRSLAGILIP